MNQLDLGQRVRLALALAVLASALGAATQGCGTTAQQHHALTVITDVADPTYEATLVGCDAARDAIVARTGTTREEDERAMAQINEVCDGIVLGFEALRGSQITARTYIDRGLGGAAITAVAEALSLWGELQALVPGLATLGVAR